MRTESKSLGKLYKEKVAFEARLVPRQEEKGRKAMKGKKYLRLVSVGKNLLSRLYYLFF